jgi:hypothetical protein
MKCLQEEDGHRNFEIRGKVPGPTLRPYGLRVAVPHDMTMKDQGVGPEETEPPREPGIHQLSKNASIHCGLSSDDVVFVRDRDTVWSTENTLPSRPFPTKPASRSENSQRYQRLKKKTQSNPLFDGMVFVQGATCIAMWWSPGTTLQEITS